MHQAQAQSPTIATGDDCHDKPLLAAYYFPNFHADPRNEVVHGKGWTEWELMRHATPRFPGHQQPKVPLWGYEDEANPEVMARKIDAAADNGVGCFIFDWYYYQDGVFLERCLNEGFLGAPNVERMKFFLMWANHHWTDIHPARLDERHRVLYQGNVDEAGFRRMVRHVVDDYFSHPSHLKIDGAPVFSIYLLQMFVQSMGSLSQARKALDYFRAETRKAGHRDLHLNAIAWQESILEGEHSPRDLEDLIQALGFDSATSYVWVHHFKMQPGKHADYCHVKDAYFQFWRKMSASLPIPLFPNVTMGWDSTPRTVQSERWEPRAYPFTPLIENNTPERFESAVREALHAVQGKKGPKLVTINAWNEWTEGSYLEPDVQNAYGYLEAIAKACGKEGAIQR